MVSENKLNAHGYLHIKINNKLYLAHRLILETFRGINDAMYCDHINRDRSDNRLSNLRWVSIAENSKNRPWGHSTKKRKIIDTSNGTIFESAHAAARHFVVHRTSVYNSIKYCHKIKGHKLAYMEEKLRI